MLGSQTRGGTMEGADKSTELWPHPNFNITLLTIFSRLADPSASGRRRWRHWRSWRDTRSASGPNWNSWPCGAPSRGSRTGCPQTLPRRRTQLRLEWRPPDPCNDDQYVNWWLPLFWHGLRVWNVSPEYRAGFRTNNLLNLSLLP